MKKLIYFLPLFILTTACTLEREVGELAETEAPRLVVNALITAGEDNQEVFFAKTGKIHTGSGFHTQFEIQVNGEILSDSKSDWLMGDRSSYKFSAENVKPGDVVSINAKNGELYANAEVEVPQPVIITGLDTMTVMVKRKSNSKELSPHTRYLVHLRLPSDVKEKEIRFFRVQVKRDVRIGFISEQRGDSITKFRYDPTYDYTNFSYFQDPALTENENNSFFDSSDIDIDWLEGDINEFHVFRSAYFENGEYTLRLDLDQVVKERYGWYQDVKIRVCSISQIEYNYLKALVFLRDNVPGTITDGEPIMPTNISGGAGIFCVESFAETDFYEGHDVVELVDGKLVPVEK